jgi:Bacterial PH domain
VTAAVNDEKGHGRRTASGETARRNPLAKAADGASAADREVFRSPVAVAIWWVWVLFAVGNLVDLAVQGRDHLSLVAAFILLFVTSVVYVTAWRPRVIADASGVTIVNPVGDHRIGWAAVAAADSTELLRVRCEWPDGDQTGRRVIYAWAVHSSRRKQAVAEMRAQRQLRRGARGFGGSGLGGSGQPGAFGAPARRAPEPVPLGVDVDRVVATITARTAQARLDVPGAQATAPLSTLNWPAIATVAAPGLALLIAALT